jgi:hypothetical protein
VRSWATANAAIAAIQSNKALALGPYVSVTGEALKGVRGPHILFTGVNVHIRSGSGATDDNVPLGGVLSGLGNLIIGYDESISPAGGGVPQPRTGSHSLILGAENTFQSYGGFVGGWRNLILAPWTSILGDLGNSASGEFASVSGGEGNIASGVESSVGGGFQNEASKWCSVVSGGADNTASGEKASVSGGHCVTSGSEFGWAGGAYHTP